MRVCTNGYSRKVYLVGRYAIKTPYLRYSWFNFIRGVFMNLREVQIYRYVRDMHPQHISLLCPVIRPLLGGLLLVMQRVETGLSEQDMRGQWQIFDDARLAGDDKCENYGRLNGRIVKLDYADCNAVFD